MTSSTIECLCQGCGLVFGFPSDDVTLAPLESERGKAMVTNQGCTACGDALVTDDAGEEELPGPCG